MVRGHLTEVALHRQGTPKVWVVFARPYQLSNLIENMTRPSICAPLFWL